MVEKEAEVSTNRKRKIMQQSVVAWSKKEFTHRYVVLIEVAKRADWETGQNSSHY